MPSYNDFSNNIYLNKNLLSYHWNREKKEKRDFNEINPGYGIEYQDGDIHYMIGQYLNSLNNNSNYALTGYTPFKYNTGYGMLSGGIIGGGVTGYPMADVVPSAGLLGNYQNDNFGINVIAVPTVQVGKDTVDGFLGIQGRYKF